MSKELKNFYSSLNTGIYDYSNGIMDLNSLLTTSFLTLGVYSFFRSKSFTTQISQIRRICWFIFWRIEALIRCCFFQEPNTGLTRLPGISKRKTSRSQPFMATRPRIKGSKSSNLELQSPFANPKKTPTSNPLRNWSRSRSPLLMTIPFPRRIAPWMRLRRKNGKRKSKKESRSFLQTGKRLKVVAGNSSSH